MNRSTDATGVVVVPVGIATADVGVAQAGREVPAGLGVQAVAVVPAGLAAAVVLAVRAAAVVLVALAVRAEAEVRRAPMVRSSPGIVRPGTKAVKRRVAELAGHCRVRQTNASMPTMPIPREALVLRAIRVSTNAVLGLRRVIVHRAAQGPKALVPARHKATAGATIVAPTGVRVPRTPPVVPVVVAVRQTGAVDLVRDRAVQKATDHSRRAMIATGVVAVAVAGTSLPFPSRYKIQQVLRPSQHPCRRLRHQPKTRARRRRIPNPSSTGAPHPPTRTLAPSACRGARTTLRLLRWLGVCLGCATEPRGGRTAGSHV